MCRRIDRDDYNPDVFEYPESYWREIEKGLDEEDRRRAEAEELHRKLEARKKK